MIIQARMTSTRLPGKVLKEVLGRPLLGYQIERLRRVKAADGVVVATTANEADGPIADLCARLSVPVFRGSEEDVLSRYYFAAREHGAETVVRLTSDCPLIDPAVVDRVIGFYIERRPDFDYVSNCLQRTYPRGMDTEVFSFKALEQAFNEAVERHDREHVTPFVYSRPRRFALANVAHGEDLSRYRWTVDTPEDFELIRLVIETLYPVKPGFAMEDVLALFEKDKSLFLINAHVEQKKPGQ
ncbi:MAG: glycosyltransferase family protein [Deltaproteobacteria bacterium]|nr:glycosyltransferase family protein [Deltaproteobacteria bacterium]